MTDNSVPMNPQKRRTGWKVGVVVMVCALVAVGGLAAATAPSWAGYLPAGVSSIIGGAPAKSMGQAVREVLFSISPEAGARQVNPAQPVTIKVVNGALSQVTLTEQSSGQTVGGKITEGGGGWTSQGKLAFDTSYRLDYSARDQAGQQISRSQTFSTVPKSNEANAWTYTGDGATVGVGQPVQIEFSEPVVNKEAVEKAITITSSAGQAGAFRWYNDKMLRYRPEGFWAAKSTVTVNMQLFGVDFGNGQIGNFNKKFTMHIGDKQILVADAATKVAQYYVNDQLVRTMPTTMGDERFPSASGYLVVMGKQETARFDAATIGLKPGDPGWYDPLTVMSATRLSNSGIFIHEATSSAMPFLGQRNLSHGCIGLNPEDARFIFDDMLAGSVVEGKNTGNETIAPTDGFGDWNIPWSQWASR